MDLKLESNATLLSETKNLVSHLNEKTVEFLERLREIESRKLHLLRGYSSLFSFVTEEFGFSAASAMRRINAMRLMREIPEVKEQISTGALNLTTVSQTQQLFKKESFSRETKLDLLVTLENKSTRAVDRELAKYTPEVILTDRMKPVSPNQNEVRFIADDELVAKLEKLKAIKAHSIQNLCELINAMADLCLEKWEPNIKRATKAKHKTETGLASKLGSVIQVKFKADSESKPDSKVGSKSENDSDSMGGPESMSDSYSYSESKSNPKSETKSSSNFVSFPESEFNPVIETKRDSTPEPAIQTNVISKFDTSPESSFFAPAPKRYIPKKMKTKIYLRDQGCCQYVDLLSGKKCQSQHFLQLDHIQPYALGGETTEENLRLYCSAHNQWRGIKTFGWSGSTRLKMSNNFNSNNVLNKKST